MKNLTTFLLFLTFILGYSQDKIYLHTATAANSWQYVTYLDFPELNDNPDAVFMFNHCWGPSGFYNNKAQGIFYTGYEWAIFNEDLTDMQEGASFNIYIPNNPDAVFIHYAFPGNQGSFPNTTVIDDPDFNGQNPGPFAVANSVMNIGETYSAKPFSFYYDTALAKRGIYINDGSAMQEGFRYRIMNFNDTEGAAAYRHEANTSNTSNNKTYLDHPELNAKPNARFVFSQYWGVNGASSEVEIASQVGAKYDSSEGKWSIYLENESLTMPEGVVFDVIIIPQPPLGVIENETSFNAILYPNPAKETINISLNKNVETISIFNMLGQEVAKTQGDKNTIQMNVAGLKAGIYLAKIYSEGLEQTLQFAKN